MTQLPVHKTIVSAYCELSVFIVSHGVLYKVFMYNTFVDPCTKTETESMTSRDTKTNHNP